MFNSLVTTMEFYENDTKNNDGLLTDDKKRGTIKEFQTVVAVGDMIKDIKVGDLVCINPSRFMVKKYAKDSLKDDLLTDNPVEGFKFDIIELDNKPCLMLQYGDIDYKVLEFEEIEPCEFEVTEGV